MALVHNLSGLLAFSCTVHFSSKGIRPFVFCCILVYMQQCTLCLITHPSAILWKMSYICVYPKSNTIIRLCALSKLCKAVRFLVQLRFVTDCIRSHMKSSMFGQNANSEQPKKTCLHYLYQVLHKCYHI